MTHLSRLAAALGLALPLTTLAAPADTDLPGPNGRSAVSVDAEAFRFDYDSSHPGGTTDVRSSNRGGSVQGTLALGQQVSIEASTGRTLGRETLRSAGSTLRSKSEQNSHSASVSVRALGNPMDRGFGLVLGFGLDHMEGDTTSRTLLVMPQFRFNEQLALSVIGTFSESSDYRQQALQAALTIKAAPNLSITPSLGFGHGKPRDASGPSSHGSWVNVNGVYHIDNHLSVLAGVRLLGYRDEDFGGGYRLTDQRGYGASVGARWQF